MRIVTWNVNSLRMRLPRVLELIEQHQPDVLCLQETKAAPDAFPGLELEAAGYRIVHHSAGQWAGVAVIARAEEPLEDRRCGLPGEPVVTEARWCEAVISGITFASVYVPNGRSLTSDEFPRKLVFLEAMADRARELRGRPAVIAGDFNVAPADVDVYDPAAFIGDTHVTPEERSRLERILDEGLIDAYRALHPSEPQFTWWDYRQGHFHRGLGLRIDLALLTPDLAERLVACGIDRNYRKGKKPSDHAPLIVDLRDD